jgi:Fe-S cluster biosynthesis and repair protein YggX
MMTGETRWSNWYDQQTALIQQQHLRLVSERRSIIERHVGYGLKDREIDSAGGYKISA